MRKRSGLGTEPYEPMVHHIQLCMGLIRCSGSLYSAYGLADNFSLNQDMFLVYRSVQVSQEVLIDGVKGLAKIDKDAYYVIFVF
jgi:hypothetical protein